MSDNEDSKTMESPKVGDFVCLIADETRTGFIVRVLDPLLGCKRFRVAHSDGTTREYVEDQLSRVDLDSGDEWIQCLSDESMTDINEFRSRLTALRLSNPQTDSIYSLMSARINFIPFQFKPLLRLLRADQPRLLIADDVGVGKTIESGLILKELSARQKLERILILSPKSLTAKWRTEMRRFDEDFRILTSETLRYCLNETFLDGEWPAEYSRVIVNYELFRLEQFLQGGDGGTRRHGLFELEPPPQFDVVIADEAHHFRNHGTSSYRLVEHLCLLSETVLFLTATPVQIHSDNLFALLNLLRPDLFSDQTIFEEVLEPNRFLSAAVRHLRSGPQRSANWKEDALSALSQAGSTRWGRRTLINNPEFRMIIEQLSASQPSDVSRVAAIRSVEELHTLANVMNRTRRRDIGRFTLRDSHTVSVPFSAEQRKLYDAVLDFRRQVLLLEHDPRVVNLILDTLQRQAASCINALAETVEDIVVSGGLAIDKMTDVDESVIEFDEIQPSLVAAARILLSAAKNLPPEDPKFEQLFDIIESTMSEEEGPGKVLVFSFFLKTISYLSRHLYDRGLRVGVITGRIVDEQREALRDRFRLDRSDPLALDVLISSEVGCEGLDYEFCDRLVNYDIPWNPMRIEQRIGRIDRYGQKSEKVMIFNFVTPETVEERVFFRCFERLGVFRDSVGDLEEILGEITQNLGRIALNPDLTLEQMEQRAQVLSDNAVRLTEEQRRLDDEKSTLLGLDNNYAADVEEIIESGRFISPADLKHLVVTYLGAFENFGSLEGTSDGEVFKIKLSEEGCHEVVRRLRSQHGSGSASKALMGKIESPNGIEVTFDQYSAGVHREIEFLTPVHPIVRLAAQHWIQVRTPLSGYFRTITEAAPPGLYIFTCEIWETIATRPDLRLVNLAINLDTLEIDDEISNGILGLIQSAQNAASGPAVADSSKIQSALDLLDATSDRRRRVRIGQIEESNEALLSQKIASLDAFYQGRLERIRAQLDLTIDQRIKRMKSSELRKVELDYEERRRDLERKGRVDVLSNRVAIGYLEVLSAK